MALTNGFDHSLLGQYGFKLGATGNPWTGLNPRTGQRESLIQGEGTVADNFEGGQTGSAGQYGFLSENPNYAHTVFKGPEQESGTKFGLLGRLASNPGLYMAAAGGMAAAGVAAGAGAAAGAGEAAAFGGSALDAGIGIPMGDGLTAATGAIGTGGGMASGSDIYGNYDLGSGVTGTEGFTGGGASPSTGGLQSVIEKVQKIPGGSSLVSRFLNGSATTEDWMSAGGKLLATALGIYGSNKQANSLRDLAGTYDGYGAPSRARFEASMTPGFDPNSIPGYRGAVDTAMKAALAKLSAGSGNPFGNPGGLIDANKQIISGTALPAIQEFQRLNANTGFGSSMNGAMNLNTQAIGADAGALNALGYGLNQVTQPQKSLKDIMESLNMTGLA